MKKDKVLGYTTLGILFAVLSVIAFAVPTVKTGTFWVAYVFTVIAFAVQVLIWKAAFDKDESLKSKFFGIPTGYVGGEYLLVQIVAFVIFLFLPTLPLWSVVIVCGTILGIAVILMISAEAGRNEIERVESRSGKKVFCIKALQADVELLSETERNPELKEALLELSEKIRFSDPMSCGESEDLETAIVTKIAELKSTVDKMEKIKEIERLLAERNRKCKILK